jgi:hypothetical protein
MKRGDAGRSSHKRALSGPRAVATGAVLYTAVRAAFAGARSIRAEHRSKQAATDETDEHTGEVAKSKTRRSRPERMPARENDLPPSLTLPNRRWAGMAAKRR